MEDLKKVIEQVIGKKDKEWEKPVYEIVKKIIDLPEGVDTTIANLIEYNPQKEMVDSLVQGKIANLVENVCNKMNIELVPTEDSLGGLAYYYHFKKIIIDSKGKKKETINEIIDDDFFTAEENTTISKVEYENLKMCEKDYFNFFGYSDFVLQITKGSLIFPENQNFDKDIMVELAEYDNNRIDIEIYSEKEYSIFIEGKKYDFVSEETFNRIKSFISSKMDTLIEWSIKQNKENLDKNAYEGGIIRHIKVKYGNLILNINGQVSDIGDLCDKFINEIKELIIGNKVLEDENSSNENNSINLEVIDWKKLVPSYDKQYSYKGCNLFLQHDSHDGVDIIAIRGNDYLDIKDRNIVAGSTGDEGAEKVALITATEYIDEAILKYESKNKTTRRKGSFDNPTNLEVVNLEHIEPSQWEYFSYKGCTMFFDWERDTWEYFLVIGRNEHLDIKNRRIGVDDYNLKDSLAIALKSIDEAIIEYESKTDKDRIIEVMQLPDDIKNLPRETQNKILVKNIKSINTKLKNADDDLEYNLNREQRTIKNNIMKIINNKEFLEAYNQIIDFVNKQEDKAKLSNAEKLEIFTLIKMLYNSILIEIKQNYLDEILYEKGNKYYFGKDVEKDYKKAFDIFKDLADNKEHLKSMEALCYMYFYGQGIDINYELARKYCEIVEQSSICSKDIFQILGEIYFEGLDVEPDYIKAKAYFEKALVEDYDDTYYKLGLLYSGNYGLPKDEEKAKEYFNKVEKDLLRAIIYLLIAIKPEGEQNLEGVYNYIDKPRKEYNNFFANSIPFDHIASINYKKVSYLNDEDYANITKNVKEKLEWCLHNDVNIEKGLFPFTSEDDVDTYADSIVRIRN